MNIALFSVVYPGIDDFFAEFLTSLSKQSCKKFILFLINDGLANVEAFLQRTNFEVKVKDAGGTPAELRKMGIQWTIESGAEVIIFADADDYFAENRVEISKSILNNHDLVFNELILTGKGLSDSMPMLGTHFSEGESVNYTRIRIANCMGLSNTAIKVKSIPAYFDKIPDSIIAFDWAFFALCLHAGTKGVFTKRTATYYRQHDHNLAAPRSFTEKQIMLSVRVKRDHYQTLSIFYEEYMPLANKFGVLLTQLESNEILRRKYCQAVRKNVYAAPLWWETIKSLEDLGL